MTKKDSAQASASGQAEPPSAESGRDEAALVWSRTCQLYADYFAALGHADTPGAIMRANANLVSGSIKSMSQGLSALQHIAATMPPPRQ